MNLIRRTDAVRALTTMAHGVCHDLDVGAVEDRRIEEKERPFVRGLAAGLHMAADALATVDPVDLFAGPGILN